MDVCDIFTYENDMIFIQKYMTFAWWKKNLRMMFTIYNKCYKYKTIVYKILDDIHIYIYIYIFDIWFIWHKSYCLMKDGQLLYNT